MNRNSGGLFEFCEELNVAERLQNLWIFTDITLKYVFTQQNKKSISVTLKLLKKKWPKDLITLETVWIWIKNTNPWFIPGASVDAKNIFLH